MARKRSDGNPKTPQLNHDAPVARRPAGSKLPRATKSPETRAGTGRPLPVEDVRDQLVPGRVLQGDYKWRLDKRLGKGGYGTVFKATRISASGDRDDPTPRLVAIKIFHAPQGGDPKMLLRRELAALLALKSDRIPRVYDHRIEGTHAFVAMAYYPHGSLFRYMQQFPKMAEREAWKLMRDLLTALRAAHRAAVLHLDIKPANVLKDGRGGFVLTDFGISQGSHVGTEVAASGLGSVGYQAPEQRDEEVDLIDTRTDLWGVGVTVWSCVTGVRPSKRPELYQANDYHALPAPRRFNKLISPVLEDAIMRMLVRDPAGRPGGAAEMLGYMRKQLKGDRPASDPTDSGLGDFDEEEARRVVKGLLDPLWATVCSGPDAWSFLARYRDGDAICEVGDHSHFAFVLLAGKVRIERDGKLLHTETREGTFLGEVATLTGNPRTAAMRAAGDVWGMVLNAAELEEFIALNPAIGIRMIHTLAERLVREAKMNKR